MTSPIVPARPSIESPPGIAYALYVHIPFCQTRCTYCAFNTYTGLAQDIPRYMQALSAELRWVGSTGHYPVDTIYFGGGTPSLVPSDDLAMVLDQCRAAFDVAPEAEITLEANPGDNDPAYFQAVHALGVNRLSIGMQSAHTSELRLFARRHSADDVRATVRSARRAGFTNLSLDLIYGIPDQTLAMWRHSLRTALTMLPDHLSLYSLGIEEGTPMQRWLSRGQVTPPDPDLAADMYEWASDTLARAGFEQYEISNWSRPGHAARHNLHYWRNHAYVGIGAGAHGYATQTRYANTLHPESYIARMLAQAEPRPFPLSAAADEITPNDTRQAISDMMIMGLRLTQEGVEIADFRRRCGVDLWDMYGPVLDRLIDLGLIERLSDRVRLTPRARLLGNLVFAEFILES